VLILFKSYYIIIIM